MAKCGPDSLASAANYLSNVGWKPNIGWGFRAKANNGVPEKYLGRDKYYKMGDWKNLGISFYNGRPLPKTSQKMSLIDPDPKDGDRSNLYLVTENFNVIMDWNRSQYFAVSVGLISDELR